MVITVAGASGSVTFGKNPQAATPLKNNKPSCRCIAVLTRRTNR